MGILDRFKKTSNNLGSTKADKDATPVAPKPSVLGDASGGLSSPSDVRPGGNSTNNAIGRQPISRSSVGAGAGNDDVLGLSRKVHTGVDAPIRITIMNGKGGSGKSTITTNLATVLSTHPNSVTIIDNDPQASSIRWLRERPHTSVPIKGVTAGEITRLKNIQLWNSGISSETKYVIVDTQAGLKGIELSDVIDRSDMIIIPVLPSAIDMRATADFVAQVFLSKAYRRTRKPIGVVANRVINDSIIYRKLQKFLLSLRMNFISTFSDNKAYLIAAEKGMGVFEVNEPDTGGEKTEWDLLAGWVEDKRQAKLKATNR